jgi:hypothetical protein
MAAPLATYTNEEQRSVISFLSSEGKKPIEIHRRMKVQYGEACLSLQQLYEWSRKFRNSVTSVVDAPRSGQAQRVVTPESIAAAEAIVMDNRRVTVKEIAANLNISHGDALTLVKNFCGALKQKVMASLRETLQKTKPGSTTTNPKPREQQGMAPFLITKTQEVLGAAICRIGYVDSLLG